MNNPYITFNKLILFTVGEYFERAIKDGITTDPFHRKIVSSVAAYRTLGRFSQSEAKKLMECGSTDEAIKIKDVEVSYIIYALELMKIWVLEVPKRYRKGIYLGISDTRLSAGRAGFALDLIKMKRDDTEQYTEKSEIILQSVKAAEDFFNYYKRGLVNDG